MTIIAFIIFIVLLYFLLYYFFKNLIPTKRLPWRSHSSLFIHSLSCSSKTRPGLFLFPLLVVLSESQNNTGTAFLGPLTSYYASRASSLPWHLSTTPVAQGACQPSELLQTPVPCPLPASAQAASLGLFWRLPDSFCGMADLGSGCPWDSVDLAQESAEGLTLLGLGVCCRQEKQAGATFTSGGPTTLASTLQWLIWGGLGPGQGWPRGKGMALC